MDAVPVAAGAAAPDGENAVVIFDRALLNGFVVAHEEQLKQISRPTQCDSFLRRSLIGARVKSTGSPTTAINRTNCPKSIWPNDVFGRAGTVFAIERVN